MGEVYPLERSRLVTPNPFISGSMTSRMMRSGSSSSTAEMACAPFPTARTAKLAKRRLVVSRSRMLGSSSTMSTRGPPVMRPVSARCLSVVWELGGGCGARALRDAHAALPVAGVEDDVVLGVARTFGDAPEQIEVGIADHLGVGGRQTVERAVGENGAATFRRSRLVAAHHQSALQCARALAELPAAVGRHSGECLANRLSGAARFFDGRRQQAAGEVVVALGNRHQDFVGCSAIKFCRSARAGPGLASQAFELDR